MSKHRNPEFYRYNLDYQSYAKMQRLCAKNRYEIMDANKLSDLLPKSFVGKSSTVLIMEKEVSGSSVFVANFNRRDVNASGSFIDQHPYIIAYDHTNSLCKGGFLDHGDWTDRTIEYTDTVLWALLSGSGVLEYLPIEQFPGKQSGEISEVKVVSHNEAFNTSLRFLEHEP